MNIHFAASFHAPDGARTESFRTANGSLRIVCAEPALGFVPGETLLEQFALPCGLTLSVSNVAIRHPLAVTYAGMKASVGFGICLSGGFIVDWEKGRPVEIISGQCADFSSPDMDLYRESLGAERVCRVSLSVEKDNLPLFEQAYPEAVALGVFTPGKKLFVRSSPISGEVRALVRQVLDCGYSGAARRFYLEAKLMELMAVKMREAQRHHKNPLPGSRPHANDVEKVRHAARLLTTELGNSPDMHSLARTVGMSRTKLHQVFQHVYSLTPYAYLRQYRLEKARTMLREGEANVTEAAFAVGYSSLSHFSKAFAARFGELPAQCFRKS